PLVSSRSATTTVGALAVTGTVAITGFANRTPDGPNWNGGPACWAGTPPGSFAVSTSFVCPIVMAVSWASAPGGNSRVTPLALTVPPAGPTVFVAITVPPGVPWELECPEQPTQASPPRATMVVAASSRLACAPPSILP